MRCDIPRFARSVGLLALTAVGALGWVPQAAPPWSQSVVELHLHLGNSTVYSDGTTPNGTAIEAMKAWNLAMARMQLTEVIEAGPTASEGPNRVNNVRFSSTLFGQSFDTGVLAVTLVDTTDGQRAETDVVVNQQEAWNSYRGNLRRNQPDLRRVLMHEFGHVIGLTHPDENGQGSSGELMNSFIGNTDAPTNDDLNGAAALYGLGVGKPGSTAPVISFISSGGLVEAGNSHTLQISVGGTGPMIFQWSYNHVPIPGANRDQLKISPVRLEDAGTYTVTVTNAAGTVSSSISLDVVGQTPPIILSFKGPEAPFRYAGGNVDISVRVKGGTPMTFTWRRGSTIVREWISGTSTSGAGVFNVQHTISPLAFTDAGDYTLTAANSGGTVTSPPMTVIVGASAYNDPLRIVSHPHSVTDSNGVAAELEVEARGIDLAYQWRKDGVAMPGKTNDYLKLGVISPETEGTYTVVVRDATDVIESYPARVKRGPALPLRIERQPSDLRLMRPQAAYVEVLATGEYPTTYQWYKNGVALPGATSYAYFGSLSGAEALGVYTVAVSDSSGRIVSNPAEIKFHPAADMGGPKIRTHPIPYTTSPGRSLELKVAIGWTGTNFNYQWQRNGVNLAGQTSYALNLYNLQPADSGDYTVVLTDQFGSTTSRPARLSVTTGGSMIYQHPASQDLFCGDTGELQYEGPTDKLQSIQWQKDGLPIPGANTAKLTFAARATEADAGSYRVVVTTTTGETILSESAIITVAPLTAPEFLGPLPDVTVRAGRPLYLSAPIRPGSAPTYQWRKNGVPIPGATYGQISIPSMRAEDAGTYSLALSNSLGAVVSNDAVISYAAGRPPVIRNHPQSQNANVFTTVRLTVGLESPENEPTYQWYKDDQAVPSLRSSSVEILVTTGTIGRYHVVVRTSQGSTTSEPAWIGTLPGQIAPLFNLHPVSQNVAVGSNVTLTAWAINTVYSITPPAPSTYQWRHNGVAIPGATQSFLTLPALDAAQTGIYTVVASDGRGTTTVSRPAEVTLDSSGRMLNLSARALSRGGGGDILIAGFALRGSGPKRILVRGIGPTLQQFGVVETLNDLELEIYNSAAKSVYSTKRWTDNDGALRATSARVGAFELPAKSFDSAAIIALDPGNYTVHIKNASTLPTPRVGLAELYDLDNSAPRLINISTRARVQPGEGALIAGFAIDQGASKRLLIRATGPALAIFGVGDRLADPKLELIRSGETAPLATNNNWGDSGDPAVMEAVFGSVGAFGLPRGSADAALVVTLPPGTYTAKVTGADPTTSGNALIEVYELPVP